MHDANPRRDDGFDFRVNYEFVAGNAPVYPTSIGKRSAAVNGNRPDWHPSRCRVPMLPEPDREAILLPGMQGDARGAKLPLPGKCGDRRCLGGLLVGPFMALGVVGDRRGRAGPLGAALRHLPSGLELKELQPGLGVEDRFGAESLSCIALDESGSVGGGSLVLADQITPSNIREAGNDRIVLCDVSRLHE